MSPPNGQKLSVKGCQLMRSWRQQWTLSQRLNLGERQQQSLVAGLCRRAKAPVAFFLCTRPTDVFVGSVEERLLHR